MPKTSLKKRMVNHMNRKTINLTCAGLLALALSACAAQNAAPTPTLTQSVSPVATATPAPEPTVEPPATPKPFAIEMTGPEAVLWNKYVKITFSHQIIQPESLPPSLVGMFYDKAGNPLTLYPEGSVIYDKNGKEGLICLIGEEVVTFFPMEFQPLEITDVIREAAQLFCSDLYYPAYIPDGYSLKYIDNYGFEDGKTPKEDMFYKFMLFQGNSSQFVVHPRYTTEMTAYETFDGIVQWVSIRGNKAYIRDDGYVAIMIGDVYYYVSGKLLTREDALNIVYSLTLIKE